MKTPFALAVEREGWATTGSVVDEDRLVQLTDRLMPSFLSSHQRGGVRNALDIPEVRELADTVVIRGLATSVLGPHCFPVRGLLFDKTPAANWRVIWHQDLTIAVRERLDVEGFGPWTEKAGVLHVQPPPSILEQMLALRVHLDDCTSDNGPVRVLPGSHGHGRLSSDEIEDWKTRVDVVETLIPRGGVLAFRPLILHASSPAKQPIHRRVVHLDFAACDLPGGLQWYHVADRGRF